MPVTVEAVACRNCGGALDATTTAGVVACGHCGSRLVVTGGVSRTVTERLDRLERTTDTLARTLDGVAVRNNTAPEPRRGGLAAVGFAAVAGVVAAWVTVGLACGSRPCGVAGLLLLAGAAAWVARRKWRQWWA